MFYDFLSAESVVGQFDNCLFSVHKPQSIGRSTENDLKERSARMVRFQWVSISVETADRVGSLASASMVSMSTTCNT